MTTIRSETVANANPWEALAAWNGPMFAAISQAGEAWTQVWLECHREMTRFIGERLDEDRRVRNSLSECRTVGEFTKLQQDWSQKAARDYAEEFGRFPQMAAKFFSGGAGPTPDLAPIQTARKAAAE